MSAEIAAIPDLRRGLSDDVEVRFWMKGGAMMDHRRIGAFLKQLREEKGLTQEQLAEHFQVSSRTVSRWETGTNLPNIDTIIDLAAYFDAEVGEIIDGERKNRNMQDGSKDEIVKAARYSNRWLIRQIVSGAIKGILIFAVVYLILNI